MVISLLSKLNTTGLAAKDPQLYQVLKEIIEDLTQETAVVAAVTVINVDTRNSAQDIFLVTAIKGLTVIKDLYGNASGNTITLVGTVDGVVDPTITTDYGVFRVYPTTNGFMSW